MVTAPAVMFPLWYVTYQGWVRWCVEALTPSPYPLMGALFGPSVQVGHTVSPDSNFYEVVLFYTLCANYIYQDLKNAVCDFEYLLC